MLIATNTRGQPALQSDGDTAFWKAANNTPAEELPRGVAAEMVNLMVDPELAAGRPRPRYGVLLSPWGRTGTSMIPAGTKWGILVNPVLGSLEIQVTGFTVGKRYLYLGGNSSFLLTTNNPPKGQINPGSTFVATQTSYWLESFVVNINTPVTAVILSIGNTRGYGRFPAPASSGTSQGATDNGVLVTDETRTTDGGQGRAWRILPNNVPQEIPLNGHDIWSPCYLVPCLNGLLLLRDAPNERHYFPAANVGTNEIQLNCQPAFVTGDEVQIVGTTGGDAILGTAAPNLGATYFVDTLSNNQIALYDTRAHAVAAGATGKLAFTSATGSFYVERISTQAGFYGNGAPVLIMQGTDTETPFDVGFEAMPTFIAVTNTNTTGNILTAPGHRLVPGDAVQFTGTISGITDATTYYAAPVSGDTLTVYTTQANAMLGGPTNQVTLNTNNQTGTVAKVNASGQPIAPGRLGVYFLQRSILVNQDGNLLISDPNDPVHYTPMQSTLTANLGDNSRIVALMTVPYDILIIIKSNNTVLALANLSQANTSWLLYEVTREFGGVAPLATAYHGAERWVLSRRGVDRLTSTLTGNVQGVAEPVSAEVQNRFQNVDWSSIAGACAEEWNNRVFFAVPFKGQAAPAGQAQNNAVLVYNTLARPPAAANASGGWEDLWTGNGGAGTPASAGGVNLLTPYAFSKLTIDGEERLTFANAFGQVCWFTNDWQDAVANAGPPTPIYTRLATRAYFQGQRVVAVKGEANWDHYNLNVTVSVRTAGVGEQAAVLQKTYDSTQYTVANDGPYNPATATPATFGAPYREEYTPSPEELFAATLDTFQNTSEPIYFGRWRGKNPQVIIETTQGAARLCRIEIGAKAVQTIGQTT